MQPIAFKNQYNETLSGTLHQPSSAGGLGFVLGHCFTCSRHTRILIDLGNMMAELGFSVLRFDFSGNGQSQGRFEESTYSKQVDEMGTAIDFLKENGADRILIGGHSMGGMVSLFTAARRTDIRGVIALAIGSEPLHPGRLLTDRQKSRLSDTGSTAFSSRGRDLVITRQFFDDAAGYDLREVLPSIRCPVLVVLAAADTVTDPLPVKALFKDTHGHMDVLEVDEADHMFSTVESRQTVIDYSSQWIRKYFSEGR
ncbi:MAG: alpha/beta fold hydrolase [Pseudomonadota bacterium]